MNLLDLAVNLFKNDGEYIVVIQDKKVNRMAQILKFRTGSSVGPIYHSLSKEQSRKYIVSIYIPEDVHNQFNTFFHSGYISCSQLTTLHKIQDMEERINLFIHVLGLMKEVYNSRVKEYITEVIQQELTNFND